MGEKKKKKNQNQNEICKRKLKGIKKMNENNIYL